MRVVSDLNVLYQYSIRRALSDAVSVGFAGVHRRGVAVGWCVSESLMTFAFAFSFTFAFALEVRGRTKAEKQVRQMRVLFRTVQ